MKPDAIIAQVTGAFNVSLEELCSRSRQADIVRARHAAMYALREHTDLSYPQIGRLFARHHTSVLHAVSSIEGARRVSRQLDDLLDSVT